MTGSVAVVAIIPCFNGAGFVGEAIDSVLAQTYPNIDIIVVNDGSRDDFQSAVARFRGAIRIIDQENRGLAAARNRGIDESRAPLLAFLDADDRWHPEKIARQVEMLERQPDCCLIHTAARYIDAAGAPIARPGGPLRVPKAEGHCLLDLVQQNSIVVSSVVVWRSALGGERFAPEPRGCEDWDLWCRLAGRGRFVCDCRALTDYRVHRDNMSRADDLMLAGSLATMNRMLERREPRAVHAAARRQRNSILISLGNLEYERGNFQRSRALFRQGASALRPTDLLRYTASCLPPGTYRRARSCWRTLRLRFAT